MSLYTHHKYLKIRSVSCQEMQRRYHLPPMLQFIITQMIWPIFRRMRQWTSFSPYLEFESSASLDGKDFYVIALFRITVLSILLLDPSCDIVNFNLLFCMTNILINSAITECALKSIR